jgi:hypothetical protein
MENKEAFLALARERFKRAVEAEREIREEARIDLEFVAGEQWDAKTKMDREALGRPALVFNKLTGPLQQVANDARQNKPAIRVNPVDSGADKVTADVLQGIVRHIEYVSKADVAYDTALEHAASCSFGFWRYLTDYVSEGSFDQEILCKQVANPFSIYIDCDAKEADRSDMRWAFVIDWMSKDAFEEKYPDSELVAAEFFDGGDSPAPEWIGSQGVQVAEYWVIETKKRKLVQLSTGEQAFEDELPELPEGVTIERSREVSFPKVCQYIINGSEVLEEHEWAGKWIPIIPVYGKEILIEGKRKLISLVRNARDPQRLHNFYKSNEAEAIALAPRPKWVGYTGQFKTKSRDWANPTSAVAYLEADPVTVNGQAAPLPQWQAFEPPIAALSAGALQAGDDIKAATNVFDASLGARSNETSGIAIQRRQTESDVSNFHFIDNLARAQQHAGNILVDLIPKIYDAAREVRIVGEDQAQKVIAVNQEYLDPETGRMKRHDLGIGRYDVTVSTGPSYTTKRQEAFDMLSQFAKAYPQLLQVAGDLIFRNSDVPGADEIADRLKKLLPPPLQQNPQGPQQIPPQAQAQMQQMQQMIQQMGSELQAAKSQLAVKKMEVESRERIALMNNQKEFIITEAQLKSKEGVMLLQQQIAAIKHQLDMLHSGAQSDVQAAQQQQAAQQPQPQQVQA